MLRAAGEYSADDFLGSIEVPALVVAGTADTFTPFALAEQLSRAMPRAALAVVASATHVAPLEQREAVGKRITQFLVDRIEANR
jgi:pimeloyl-ACP methyl ester carboxylesterase